MQFRVIVATDPHRPPVANPQTGPITVHCAAKLSAQCNQKREQTVVFALGSTLLYLYVVLRNGKKERKSDFLIV